MTGDGDGVLEGFGLAGDGDGVLEGVGVGHGVGLAATGMVGVVTGLGPWLAK